MRVRRAKSASRGVTGLDIQPGEVVAAEVGPDRAVRRAIAMPIDPGFVRDGEVADVEGLAGALRELFSSSKLSTRVRVGLASQRAVMRTVDLPPLEDERDIAAAVRLQAGDHIAMPLAHAVVDHRVLGPVETADGRRTRVVVAAAQRESVDRLLAALRRAGLRPEGIDLSAFALVRGLDRGRPGDEPVLYAQVAGVTTLAVARAAHCELTRVAPVGLEALAQRLAEREGIVLTAARDRLLAYGSPDVPGDEAALEVLDAGLAELADELRNTMEFYAAQAAGAAVEEVVLTGPAATIPNFSDVLAQRVGVPVVAGIPRGAAPETLDARHRACASVAIGLAVEELAA